MTRNIKPAETVGLLATPANMAAVDDQPGVFAYSPLSGEEASATAGDYWDWDPNAPLLDGWDEPMILVRRVSKIVGVTL